MFSLHLCFFCFPIWEEVVKNPRMEDLSGHFVESVSIRGKNSSGVVIFLVQRWSTGERIHNGSLWWTGGTDSPPSSPLMKIAPNMWRLINICWKDNTLGHVLLTSDPVVAHWSCMMWVVRNVLDLVSCRTTLGLGWSLWESLFSFSADLSDAWYYHEFFKMINPYIWHGMSSLLRWTVCFP